MDHLSTQFFDLTAVQDEPIDPQLQGAIKQYNSSPIRIKKPSETSDINDKYKVLSSDEIVQYVVNFVEEVNSIVQLQPTVTRMLLSYCKWDPNHLTENFYNNPEKLFKEARVINPFNVLVNGKTVESAENNECKICYGEVSSGKTIGCGHKFCTACWSEYLKIKIMDEGVGNSILCPESDCDVIIDDETVIELVNSLQVKHRYQHFITNSFVQQNPLLRWCPAAGCSFAIKVDYSPIKPISCHCKCGHEFCFDCGDVPHGPVPCALLKRFSDQLKEPTFRPYMLREDELFGYSDVIKTCPNPNCAVSIQKIVGCHVMKCKNCSTNFCWVCLNRYKTKAAVYCHLCPGDEESKSADVPKSTETKKENHGEDVELAPPKKCVKLSINEFLVRAEFEQNKATSNGSEPSTLQSSQQQKVNETETLQPDHPIEEDKKDNDVAELDPDGNGYLRTLGIFPPMRYNHLRLGRLGQPPHLTELHRPFRFHSYFNKYNAEDEKYKTAVTQSTQIKQALQCLSEKSENLVQIGLAAILLVHSRHTLKYSALFAMYLNDIEKSLLFSNLYQDLEVASTALANAMSYVNVHIPESHEHIPESVIPAQRNCQLRRRALLDYIDEGYDNGVWTFSDRPKN